MKKWLVLFFIFFFIKVNSVWADPPSTWCYSTGNYTYTDNKCYYCPAPNVPPSLVYNYPCPTPSSTPTLTKMPTLSPTIYQSSPPPNSWCSYYGKRDTYNNKCYFCSVINVIPTLVYNYPCPIPSSTPTLTKMPTLSPTIYQTGPPPSWCQSAGKKDIYNGKCYSCSGINTPPTNYPCPTPTPTKIPTSYSDECRCKNGFWSGNLCDNLLLGRNCFPQGVTTCSANNQPCTGPSDTKCCSGYCVSTYYGYYCRSAKEVARGCQPGDKKCDGQYLLKCENGDWVKDKYCSDSCQQSSSGADCVTQINSSLSVNKTCVIFNECCGTNMICKTGSGRPGMRGGVGLSCQSCPNNQICQAGQGCVDESCQIGGSVKTKDNKCFTCYFFQGQSEGKMIETSSNLCEEVTSGKKARIEANEIVVNAISSEDQYKLRQDSYNAYMGNKDISIWDKAKAGLLKVGDGLTFYTFGQIPRLLGGEAESSLGNYYVANANANASAIAEGRERKVNLGQAIATGVVGGYKYANDMTLGIPDGIANLVTGGKTRDWEKKTMVSLYGGHEAEANAAMSSMRAGTDLTNIATILVPVGKGVGSVGKVINNAAGGKIGISSALLRGSGKTLSTLGKGIELLSPETWAAPFIKSAPITTFIEQGAASFKGLEVVANASEKVTSTIAELKVNSPVIAKVFDIGEGVTLSGKKTVDFLIPRSALEYSPQEAAKYLSRDIKLGIISPDDVTQRLVSRYRQTLSSSQINKIVNNLDADLGGEQIDQVSNQLYHDLLNPPVKGPTFSQKIQEFFSGKEKPTEVVVVPDIHSDTNALMTYLIENEIVSKTGELLDNNKFAVIVGDYFGKTSSELVAESKTPGFDALKKVIALQDESGGRIIAQAGNWEPRTANAIRLQRLQQTADELIAKGDSEAAQTLLSTNGYGSTQALTDEITRFLKLDKGTGALPLSREEINLLANNFDEVSNLMGKLKFISQLPDGKLVQHVDDAELLRYVFNTAEEIDSLGLGSDMTEALKKIISDRGSKSYLTPEDLRLLNSSFTQLGWTSDQVVGRINNNASQILTDGITKIDDQASGILLSQLEGDMSKDLRFYQDPQLTIEYANIFGQKGKDFRIVHGHSPISEIQKALSALGPSSAYQEIGPGVWILKEDPRIVLQGADVKLSRGMRVLGPNGDFLPKLDGVIQIPDNVVRGNIQTGLSRIAINTDDPLYFYYMQIRNFWAIRMNGRN